MEFTFFSLKIRPKLQHKPPKMANSKFQPPISPINWTKHVWVWHEERFVVPSAFSSSQQLTWSKDSMPTYVYLDVPSTAEVKSTKFDVKVPGMRGVIPQGNNFKLNQWHTFIVFGRQLVSADFNNIPECVWFGYSPFLCPPKSILLSALRNWRFALLNHIIDVYLSPKSDCSLGFCLY